MKVERFTTGIFSTNCYLVSNTETKEAVIVDPAAYPMKLQDRIRTEGLKVVAVLLTHGHFDHILGIDDVLKNFDVPVYLHKDDEETINSVYLNLSRSYTGGYTFGGSNYIEDGQVLELAGYKFQVIHTPGHTPGGACYYIESEGTLFSGDTLFANSVGRTDFENGCTSDLVRSIKEKLFQLPDDVLVYPGHMGETTIGHEKKYNPYV